MAIGRNADGSLTVRVELQVRVDRDDWARDVMGTDPDEVLDKLIRRSVKREVRQRVAEMSMETAPEAAEDEHFPVLDVRVQGIYDQ